MINTNKIIYYLSCLIVSIVILMAAGEQTCRCNCAFVQKYAIKSYVFGDEYLIKNTNLGPSTEQTTNESLCTESTKFYRFPVEIIAALLFLIIMTGFIIF